jgi:hypothetical protein
MKPDMNVSAQVEQSGAVNKTSVEPAAQDDDFREVKLRKTQISNDTSQTAKKSTKSVPKSVSCQAAFKVVLICNFLRLSELLTWTRETTAAENNVPEQEAPRKSGRPPPIVMTSTTNLILRQSDLKENLILLQSDLKEQVKGQYEFRNEH